EEVVFNFPSVKYEWLEDFLVDIESDAQIVIFHDFTHSGERICSLLDELKMKYVWIYGGTGVKNQPALLHKFQEKKVQVLVINAATGDVGVDLQIVDYQIFFESPVPVITRQQVEARAMGQERGKRSL